MGRILRRPAAKRDLVDIYRYIAREAPARAGPLLERIHAKLVTLSDAPMIGTARLPRFPEVRMFPVGNYVILYRPLPEGNGIEVIRVVHGAREWWELVGDGER